MDAELNAMPVEFCELKLKRVLSTRFWLCCKVSSLEQQSYKLKKSNNDGYFLLLAMTLLEIER